MEIHPPDHALHTRRDFFIHMATIVLGLLIAIGLEQSVEALHRRHQLHELREALQSDSEIALRNDNDLVLDAQARLDWSRARIAQVESALQHHTPISDIEQKKIFIHAIPVYPAWKAAKASNLLQVMPQDDIEAFSEVDDLINRFQVLYQDQSTGTPRFAFEQQFRTGPEANTFDFSSATHADLVQYLILLNAESRNLLARYAWSLYLRGALQAVLNGERNVDRIDDAENKAAGQS
jgi:hypothetical protein